MTRYPHLSVSGLLTATAVLLAAIANPAAAQASSQSTTGERFDVRAVCPTIEKTLREELAPMWRLDQPVGKMQVQFQLRGSSMRAVHITGVPARQFPETRRLLRHAINGLDCNNSSQESQQFSFLVEFRSPEDTRAATASGEQRVALIEP